MTRAHQIVLERGAGESAGFPDSSYQNVEIVNTAQKVWESADLVVKVKEPQKEEFKYFRQNQIIFTYLHLAAVPDLTLELVKKNVTGIAYETIQNNNGSLPLLEPMSEIAGRLSPQIAARVLQSDFNGQGSCWAAFQALNHADLSLLEEVQLGLTQHLSLQLWELESRSLI
ncbi:MAG: hypothetical protein CM1200mP8_5720 [Chloroflexota bacterium]|nr:MAG: hypothetical protein CM1200mP8_5720 [Chloroflexota bacterium]